MQQLMRRRAIDWLSVACSALVLATVASEPVRAQQASISAWDAADFRVWGYIPYWANGTTISSLATNGMYTHVSDVLYFGAVRPDANGNLPFAASSYQTNLATLRSQATTHGFDLHLSVFEVSGGADIDDTWSSIVNSPTARANFVNSAKNLLLGGAGTADDLKGFNFDWERPNSAALWGNYTQLAKELRTAINPLGMEVSVCDYGSTDYRWDDTASFDPKAYDQLFVMSYHLTASSTGTYATQKLSLTQPGTSNTFTDDQIALGFGTWGKGVDPDGDGPMAAPTTYTMKDIVAAHPSLPYDALTVVESTDTWKIESRKQVREKTQVALDRGMPGMFSWTLHYDATNNLGLHRVMHHYTVFKRGVPDLNLDGSVNATDANTLANNMGTVPGWKGTATAAQFENFYISGNWEKGDRDGNGFVNQLDADWLAGRYTALGVNLPDRLAYSGTFEGFQDSQGLTGRWRGIRDAGKIRETGNYTQHAANYLAFSGSGVGVGKHSNYAVTLRNQNSAEAFDTLNTLPRIMQADLTTPIDLGQNAETYFTFLVRQNTAPLLASQLASNNRTLSLQFQDAASVVQFDFSLFGKQEQFAIESLVDVTGDDVTAGGFAPNTTYLFVGKLSGNGAGANTMQASLVPSGSVVGNFTDPSFPWMLTAHGSANFNPVLTQIQLMSLYEANYTVSNVWIGAAAAFFAPTATSLGDYNSDGTVDAADYLVWRNTMGQTGAGLAADGNGNNQIDSGDYAVWTAHFGQAAGSGSALGATGSASALVPEPSSVSLAAAAALLAAIAARRRARRNAASHSLLQRN